MAAVDVAQYERWTEAEAEVAADLQLAGMVLGPEAIARSVAQIEDAEVIDA